MSIDAACPASNSVHPPNELNATSTSNRLISVLEDPVNYNVKHPLQYGWSLWLKKADAKPAPAANNDSSTASSAPKSSMEIWRDSVENLGGNIRTVEDFWWYCYDIIMTLSHHNGLVCSIIFRLWVSSRPARTTFSSRTASSRPGRTPTMSAAASLLLPWLRAGVIVTVPRAALPNPRLTGRPSGSMPYVPFDESH